MSSRSPLIPGPDVEGSRPRAAAAFHRLNYRNAPGAATASQKYRPVELQGRTILNGLNRLAHHRRLTGKSLGHDWSWLETAAAVAAAIVGANVTARNVEGVCTRIGLPPQKPGIYEVLASHAGDARRIAGPNDLGLLDPEIIGRKVELTAEERDNLAIKRIGSINETPKERKLRQDRERKAGGRAAKGVTPRRKSKAATKPWEAMGISKSTYYSKGLHRVRTDSSD